MNGRIIVVDDEPLILNAVERALSKVGHSVVKAANAGELKTALAGAPFDLLIADVHMPDISLEEVVAAVRETSPGIRLLKMSGGRDDSGAHFIEKPFSIAVLRNKVQEILDEPS